jgi:hypothetical protein
MRFEMGLAWPWPSPRSGVGSIERDSMFSHDYSDLYRVAQSGR